jgi:hypothetical protein
MASVVIAVAVIAVLLHHYVFSFQRFTLAVARAHAPCGEDVQALQTLMSPAGMGALGWLSTFSILGAAVWIGFTFAWWWGVLFFAAQFIVLGGVAPLIPARRHFASLASRELARHVAGPNAQLALILMSDVRRLGQGLPLR